MNFVEAFRHPKYERLLTGARESLEGRRGALHGTFSVPDLDAAERAALTGLLGRPRNPDAARSVVHLRKLDEAVRTSCGLGLVELLETIGPKLRDRKAEKDAKATARAELLRIAEASPLHEREGWYREWVRSPGRLARLTPRLLTQAIAVFERLEADRPVFLPELADAATGDTKALNHESPLSTQVLAALAGRLGVDRPEGAEDRRALWEAFNVLPDDLASRVLVLNLPAEGDGLGEWLTGAARHGTPFQVTLHQLTTLPITTRCPVVYVCENPTVLRRAAAEAGAASPPLLCTEGLPSIAFHRLAETITAGGGTLRYHGDFDWPGILMATSVIRRHGALPWRMSAADYRAGLRGTDRHLPLKGRPRPTPWAGDLMPAMVEAGAVVYEETVADRLLIDLT